MFVVVEELIVVDMLNVYVYVEVDIEIEKDGCVYVIVIDVPTTYCDVDCRYYCSFEEREKVGTECNNLDDVKII